LPVFTGNFFVMNSFPRIVFFGTPSIAVASLERLISKGYPVVGVVTAPDRPSGRGLRVKQPEVKEYAIMHELTILQPSNLKDPGFLAQLSGLSPDLQVVVAFRMLPESVWALPPLGTFNLHASLLPQYRGAAPINWALINGEKETGVTTFFLEKTIDTGNILFSERTPIGPDETAGELHDRLMEMGAELVCRTVDAIIHEQIEPKAQEGFSFTAGPIKTAPKLVREDGLIHWDADVFSIHNRIRGLSPFPGSYTSLMSPGHAPVDLKVCLVRPELADNTGNPGRLLTDGRNYLKVSARNGYIHLLKVQPSGRKVMEISEFLRGYGRHFL
jgi:methionyl-tRNA formyltransferase